MKRLLPLTLAAATLLAACQKDPPPAIPAESGVYEELKGQIEALERKLGPDAYSDPEMAVLIAALEAFPADSTSRQKAERHALELKAKRKAALIAIGELKVPPPAWEPEKPPSYGPLRVEGKAPDGSPDALERIAKVAVGTPRTELLAAYGSCLVRQTWFPGSNGGVTTELFHVARDCREELEPRVFTVAGDQVIRLAPGTLDGIMEDNLPDADERPARPASTEPQ